MRDFKNPTKIKEINDLHTVTSNHVCRNKVNYALYITLVLHEIYIPRYNSIYTNTVIRLHTH